MKVVRNLIVVIGVAVLAFSPISPVTSALVVSAQSDIPANSNILCRVFPFIAQINFFDISSICTGAENSNLTKDNIQTQALNLVRLGTSLIFVGIIIVAVYIIIKAAIKYIRSEGDDKKIEEASKSIKSVFVGLIALFIGIIGLVLILVLFDSLGALNQAPTTEELLPDATTGTCNPGYTLQNGVCVEKGS